jgi:uncharacterized protein
MNITQEFGDARYVIRGYEPGAVQVNETRYTGSLVVMPEQLRTDWEPERVEDLSEHHLRLIADLHPEVVILGTGTRFRFPAPEVQAFFLRQGIGIEAMDTAAACRTYNVLMAEGRNVACALLLVTGA